MNNLFPHTHIYAHTHTHPHTHTPTHPHTHTPTHPHTHTPTHPHTHTPTHHPHTPPPHTTTTTPPPHHHHTHHHTPPPHTTTTHHHHIPPPHTTTTYHHHIPPPPPPPPPPPRPRRKKNKLRTTPRTPWNQKCRKASAGPPAVRLVEQLAATQQRAPPTLRGPNLATGPSPGRTSSSHLKPTLKGARRKGRSRTHGRIHVSQRSHTGTQPWPEHRPLHGKGGQRLPDHDDVPPGMPPRRTYAEANSDCPFFTFLNITKAMDGLLPTRFAQRNASCLHNYPENKELITRRTVESKGEGDQ